MPATRESRTYAQEVGVRLRAIRTQKNLSLQRVEVLSRGRWKMAAVGSYERGDRMISMKQLADLAAFYGVPVRALLPGEHPDVLPQRTARVVLNLPALARASTDDVGPLRRWVAEIQRERGDYAGHVLSIRDADLHTLATLYTLDRDQLLDRFQQWEVLDATSSLRSTPDPA
ncbi:transcriptional regulator [Frankia sp. R82]|uniref:transcriptional regulator n=1 Tax=Frankia sp. R82 TaxID=2950553 RepID=UPI002044BAC1|nr:transcriptional regulator [Frankia sp. R82]MCM3883162.1 transcriptional regulator [Frankia sp. R82]